MRSGRRSAEGTRSQWEAADARQHPDRCRNASNVGGAGGRQIQTRFSSATLTAVRVTNLHSSSMMMKPYADRPTIMAITDPMCQIDLVQGPGC
jgi:hypothetical protein